MARSRAACGFDSRSDLERQSSLLKNLSILLGGPKKLRRVSTLGLWAASEFLKTRDLMFQNYGAREICKKLSVSIEGVNNQLRRLSSVGMDLSPSLKQPALSQSRTKTMKALKKSNPMEARSNRLIGIGEWAADVENRDCSSSNHEEDAITSDDQMPNGNTQLFALRRERTSHWQ